MRGGGRRRCGSMALQPISCASIWLAVRRMDCVSKVGSGFIRPILRCRDRKSMRAERIINIMSVILPDIVDHRPGFRLVRFFCDKNPILL